MAFLAIWRMLNGGAQQDFRLLAARLRRSCFGLIAFWVADYLMWQVMPFLLGARDAALRPVDPRIWVPINIEIVLLILAVALLAISHTLERAWVAEDVVQHFL